MPSPPPLRNRLAETRRSRLLVRARELASGWASGGHRADRKGSGVEFAGHRAYSPGDDLRHLDRHALLKHKQLLIREFLTDTERSLHLVVDFTASMHYRGMPSKGANEPRQAKAPRETKAQRALLLAAALAHVGREMGDHVGLSFIEDAQRKTRKPRGGGEAFEQVMHELVALDERSERIVTEEDAAEPSAQPADFDALFRELGAAVPRGSVIVVLSDFLDLDAKAQRSLAALCTQKRTVRAAQIVTAEEAEFPFEGALRFRDLETGREVETDGAHARSEYLSAFEAHTKGLQRELLAQGGLLVRARTDAPPEDALRQLASGETPG